MHIVERIQRNLKQIVVGLLLVTGLLSFTPVVQAATTKAFTGSVAGSSNTGWVTSVTKNPGEQVQYLMSYHNVTSAVQKQVSVTARPPANSATIENSITLFNPAHPNGTKQLNPTSDGVGIKLGTLKPGQTAFVQYSLTLPSAANLSCGNNVVTNKLSATVGDTGQHYTASPTVKIHRDCQPAAAPQPKPVYRCNVFEPTTGSGGYVAVSDFSYTAKNGATYLGAAINWGDGAKTKRQMDLHLVSHTYAKNGNYKIVASVYFAVKGQGTKIVTCQKVLAIDSVKAAAAPVSRAQTPTTTAESTPAIDTDDSSVNTEDTSDAVSSNTSDVTTTSDTATGADTTTDATADDTAADATPVDSTDTDTSDSSDTTTTPTQTVDANPTALPNTGVGNNIAVMGLVVVAVGALGYQFWLRRIISK